MFLEIAIGDAYGAGFEFCSREKINKYNSLSTYVDHELGIKAGHYTDDTQMSLAVLEVLLTVKEPVSLDFAHAFVAVYKRNVRQGYAKGLQGLLEQCADGNDLQRLIRPISKRNGAAMRSVPLGLIVDLDRLLNIAKQQAIVTHHSEEGILSSQIVGFIAHCLYYRIATLNELPQMIKQTLNFDVELNWQQEVECDAIQTIHAVTTMLIRHRNLSNLLQDCIHLGGDVDSVASIALGLASLSVEYHQDLPENLLNQLENQQYGRDFLIDLDQKIKELSL